MLEREYTLDGRQSAAQDVDSRFVVLIGMSHVSASFLTRNEWCLSSASKF